jgi:serine/threonine protein kinase
VFQPEDILEQKYQLKERLGRTAAGHQTWLAWDLASTEAADTRVTVKLLAFNPQMRWEELKLFEREGQVLRALNHPRIPKYRDYFDIDKELGNGVPWFALVQDYIPGRSLQEALESGKRFTEKQVRTFAKEVLDILIYLHELSPPVLHRDLKPSNLILGEDEHIYAIDFGAVQAQASVTGVTFTVVGTSGYAPLEQFWGRAVAASDVYALGATLIHLLTGVTPADLPLKDSRLQFSDRVSLHPDFLGWLEKATEISIERRFQTARDALEALKSPPPRAVIAAKAKDSLYRKILPPYYTSIKLDKDKDYLQIKIPAGGMGKLISDILNIGCLTALFLSICFIFVGALSFAIPLFGLLVLIAAVIKIVLGVGETTRLEFDRRQVNIWNQIFSLKFGKKNLRNESIIRVLIHSKGGFYQVVLRSFNELHYLGGALTEEEASWLVQEIEDWLND